MPVIRCQNQREFSAAQPKSPTRAARNSAVLNASTRRGDRDSLVVKAFLSHWGIGGDGSGASSVDHGTQRVLPTVHAEAWRKLKQTEQDAAISSPPTTASDSRTEQPPVAKLPQSR